MLKGIRGQRVLITGATGGIGSAMVRLFAANGARLGIHYYRQRQVAERLLKEVARSKAKAKVFQADLTVHAQALKLVKSFVQHFGGIDVLINNAGAVAQAADWKDLNEQAWEETLALNAKAPFFLSQAAFAYMKKEGGGRIIQISSIAVKYAGSSKTLHYAAAKSALETASLGLAQAGAPHNILVSTIRGGFIQTPFHKKIGRKSSSKRIQMIPLKRAGQPDDIAQTALFLASRASQFITGDTITVAGGD